MKLPSYWREPAFSVAEVADIIAVPEINLRNWMQRAPDDSWCGLRQRGRLYLSALQALYFALVARYARYGVPVRIAMLAAADHAKAIGREGAPEDEHLVVEVDGPKTRFSLVAGAPALDRPALIIPVEGLLADLIAAASNVYLSEASA